MLAVRHNPKDIARLIDSNLEIPTIPVVASKALRAMQDENANANRLATILQEDPGLTARILKVANSALYSLPREIKSLSQAAMVMGFDGLKGLVLSAACRGIYKRYGDRERALWIHSVACAHAAQEIAKLAGVPSDEAFVAGLMHDVGRVVMNNGARERLGQAENVARVEGIDAVAAEQRVFGYTHCDVGGVLVGRWELSKSLEQAVFFHHDIELVDSLAPESRGLIFVVHLANRFCHAVGAGCEVEEDLDLACEESAIELGLDEGPLGEVAAAVQARLQKSEG